MLLDQKNISLMSRKGYVQTRGNVVQIAFKIYKVDLNDARDNQTQLSQSGFSYKRTANHV